MFRGVIFIILSVATLGEMDLLRGKVIFIEHVLFLDDEKLEELKQEYG